MGLKVMASCSMHNGFAEAGNAARKDMAIATLRGLGARCRPASVMLVYRLMEVMMLGSTGREGIRTYRMCYLWGEQALLIIPCLHTFETATSPT